MPVKHLTDAFLRNVRPPRKEDKPNQRVYYERLERGLSLLLIASFGGSKTFRALIYRGGKAKTHKLGQYPQMSVKQAREAARQYWAHPDQFAQRALTGTFREVAEAWLTHHVRATGLRSEPEIVRQLAYYVYPKWGDCPFLELRRREVNELLDALTEHGLATTDAVLATIRRIMGWYQTRSDDYTSPIVRGMERNKQRKARARILSDDELRAVWTAAGEIGAFGAFVKLCLLTAQRRAKVLTMQWADLSDGVWTIAAAEREKGTAGQLKLPQAALDVIASLPAYFGNPYVFAGRDGNPFGSLSLHKQELTRRAGQIPHWTIHDLRRTARSLLSRAGVRPDVSERVMGHVIGGVEGVYDRYSYLQEKADALERLAVLIERIVNPLEGNVVQLRG
jgi:integrase